MRVLVMGAPGPTTEDAVQRLEDAGHAIVRCHDEREPAFPCKGVTAHCPLDDGPVDVALAVRNHAWPRPTVFDRGVTCALRDAVPVVVAGVVTLNPYDEWAAAVIGRDADVVGTVERVASSPVRIPEAVACDALRAGLVARGVPAWSARLARSEITKQAGRMTITLFMPHGVTSWTAQNVANYVVGAIRADDRRARVIDLRIVPAEADAASP